MWIKWITSVKSQKIRVFLVDNILSGCENQYTVVYIILYKMVVLSGRFLTKYDKTKTGQMPRFSLYMMYYFFSILSVPI